MTWYLLLKEKNHLSNGGVKMKYMRLWGQNTNNKNSIYKYLSPSPKWLTAMFEKGR